MQKRVSEREKEEEDWMEVLTQMASSTYSGLFCNIPKASYVSPGASWTQFSRHELGATRRAKNLRPANQRPSAQPRAAIGPRTPHSPNLLQTS